MFALMKVHTTKSLNMNLNVVISRVTVKSNETTGRDRDALHLYFRYEAQVLGISYLGPSPLVPVGISPRLLTRLLERVVFHIGELIQP